MTRRGLIGVVLLSTCLGRVYAQAPSPAQMGITPTTLPEVLQVLDASKTWVPFANIDPATHKFSLIGGSANVAGVVQTHAALLALNTPDPVNGPFVVQRSGFYNGGDGGGAIFDWYATSYCPGGTSTAPTPANQLTCVRPADNSSDATPGRYKIRLVGNTLTSAMVGMVNDGVTDNSPIMDQVLAFELNGGLPANLGSQLSSGNGWPFRFGSGNYYFSRPIELHVQMDIGGQAFGGTNVVWAPTRLTFNDNIAGIVINGINTCWQYGYDTTNCPKGTAAGSWIHDLQLTTKSGTTGQTPLFPHAYGVWIRQPARVENVMVYAFANDGIRAYCSSGSTTLSITGVCNGWIIRNVTLTENWGNGIYIRGSDANTGLEEMANCYANGLFCIWDEAFLNSTHMAPQEAGDGAFGVAHSQIAPNAHMVYTMNAGTPTFYNIQQSYNFNTEKPIWQGAQTNPPTGAQTSNTWWWWVSQIPTSSFTNAYGQSVKWGEVVENNTVCDVQPNSTAYGNMWTTDPITDSAAGAATWTCSGTPQSGYRYIDWVNASKMVNSQPPYQDYGGGALPDKGPYGPYIPGGSYRDGNIWIGPYEESSYWTYHHMPGAFVLGGGVLNNTQAAPTGTPNSINASTLAPGSTSSNNKGTWIGSMPNGIIGTTGITLTPGGLQVTASSANVAATCTYSTSPPASLPSCGPNAGRFTLNATPNSVFTLLVNIGNTAPVCMVTDETTAAANPFHVTHAAAGHMDFTSTAPMQTSDNIAYICMGI